MGGIVNPSERYFKDGLWTFDGTVWRPQSQLISYRSVIHEAYNLTTAAAGTNSYSFTAVPAGKVAVISSVYAANFVTAASYLAAYINSGVTSYILEFTQYAAVTRFLNSKGQFILAAGELIKVYWFACVLNDTIGAAINGHLFDIAE